MQRYQDNIDCQLVSPEFYRVSDLLLTTESRCGFSESELVADSGWRVVSAALTAGSASSGGTSVDCTTGAVGSALSGASTWAFQNTSSLGGGTDQTAFNLGTTVGFVAASDVFGSGALANGAECVYSDMGLGAEHSIVDCRSVGMSDLGSECG